jgi:hypothetical protein
MIMTMNCESFQIISAPYRRLEEVAVLVDPALQVERAQWRGHRFLLLPLDGLDLAP